MEPLPFGPAQTNSEILIETDQGMWVGGIANPPEPSGITLFDVERGYWDLFRVGYEIIFGQDELSCGTRAGDEWWFGTTDGIQIYIPESGSWVPISESRGLPDPRITAIAFDGNYVYVGTAAGMSRMSPVSKARVEWTLSQEIQHLPIRTLHWDGKALWISTDMGLLRWTASTDKVQFYGGSGDQTVELTPISDISFALLKSPITAIVSSDSMVYFGDELGILVYERGSGNWRRITGQSRLVGLQILTLELSEGPGETDEL
ncbi:MAG: hypothetical protein ACE5GH_03535, partial [Fidelibacterota bacterium]